MSLKSLFSLLILVNFFCFYNAPTIAMEPKDQEEEEQLSKHPKRNKGKEEEGVTNLDGNEIAQEIRQDLINRFRTEKNLKIVECDPQTIKTLLLGYPRLQKGEPNLIFLILPNSLGVTPEERPKKAQGRKEKSAQQLIQEELHRLLEDRQGRVNEETGLLSFPVQEIHKPDEGWDSIPRFIFKLDESFFKEEPKTCKNITPKVIAGAFGCVAPLPICGIILYSIGNIFGFPSGGWLSDTLSVWITVNVAPVSVRQLCERVGAIIDKEDFISLEEDMKLFNKKYRVPEEGIIGGVIKSEDEIHNPERSTPHIFKKSKAHKAAQIALIPSSALNALLYSMITILTYQDFDKDKLHGFPLSYILAGFVGLHYGENYYNFGSKSLWDLFSHYSYIGKGQLSEEDSREKRKIMIERIRQFQNKIADPRYSAYAKKVYELILEQKNKVIVQDDQEAEDHYISAISLLMMKDKVRVEADKEDEEEMRDETGAVNFKQDLDVIKVSLKEDFLDVLTACIVGAGALADTEIIRYTLQQFCQEVLGLDATTSAEVASFWSVALLDTSFRGIIEFKLHQNNLKSWLKTFSVRHFVDFQWLRKGFGGLATINAALHTLPKFFQGWSALESSTSSLIVKLGLLIPSTVNTFSLNQAIFEEHYNEGFRDLVTVGKKENFGFRRQMAQLKKWSDKAMLYIGSRFDDETVGKLYSGVHQGM
ncbi:MAG: hypothetical protein K2Y08_05495 [Alphaproteobacteria bacterium]|nr:hypothetical protein [Alphaproteobacteria bacterium]